MTMHYLPRRKPTPDQLELPRVKIYELLHDLSSTLAERQLAVMTANRAEDFAKALIDAHEELAKASRGFAALVDATRDWR